jgi:hypothetical protein
MIGGLGTDTYDANTSPELADETIAVTVNGLGNGTVAKTNDATTDTFSGIETFIAGEAAGESDSIVITDAVTKEQVTDISDGAVGVFTPDFGTSGPIAFGGPGEPTINDLLSGTYVDPTHGPIWASGTYQITGGEEDGATVGATSFSNFEQSEVNVVCYAPGSLIRTPSGDKRVEDLRVGDLVETQDAGPCPIRWVRSSDQPLDGAAQDDCPVLIQAGALGDGRPARDLVVSPQHRILVGGHGHLEDRFDEECFVPAKALTGLPKVRHMNGKRAITWVHFALDTHHVVLANGLLSESLYLGPMVVRGLTRDERGALERLFGPMPTDGSALNGPPARPFLTVRQAHRRLTRPARIQPASGQQPQALRA